MAISSSLLLSDYVTVTKQGVKKNILRFLKDAMIELKTLIDAECTEMTDAECETKRSSSEYKAAKAKFIEENPTATDQDIENFIVSMLDYDIQIDFKGKIDKLLSNSTKCAAFRNYLATLKAYLDTEYDTFKSTVSEMYGVGSNIINSIFFDDMVSSTYSNPDDKTKCYTIRYNKQLRYSHKTFYVDVVQVVISSAYDTTTETITVSLKTSVVEHMTCTL